MELLHILLACLIFNNECISATMYWSKCISVLQCSIWENVSFCPVLVSWMLFGCHLFFVFVSWIFQYFIYFIPLLSSSALLVIWVSDVYESWLAKVWSIDWLLTLSADKQVLWGAHQWRGGADHRKAAAHLRQRKKQHFNNDFRNLLYLRYHIYKAYKDTHYLNSFTKHPDLVFKST